MAWISWNKLSIQKRKEGLGFRDIEEFNDSLLAKLNWRIQNSQESLISKVLLEKYCHDTSFLDCETKSNSSHGWKGILAGKEVMRKGLHWLVGSGEHINVWKDPWLSTSQPSIPYGPPTKQNSELKVKDLLHTANNEWNVPKIRKHLPHYEKIIRQLHPSSLKPSDRLVWLLDPSGEFTTKIGYSLLKQKEQSPRDKEFNWNGNIWKLHFIWRATIGTLPVGGNLTSRGVTSDLRCKRCDKSNQHFISYGHALLQWRYGTEHRLDKM